MVSVACFGVRVSVMFPLMFVQGMYFTIIYVCCCLPVIMWFLFGEVSSSSGCLGWATLFYCGTL